MDPLPVLAARAPEIHSHEGGEGLLEHSIQFLKPPIELGKVNGTRFYLGV